MGRVSSLLILRNAFLAGVLSIPQALLVISTLIQFPFEDSLATAPLPATWDAPQAQQLALYYGCVVYTAGCLLLLSYLSSSWQLIRQVFNFGVGYGVVSRVGSALFLLLLPAALVALQTLDHLDVYRDAVEKLDLNSVLLVAYHVFLSFASSAHVWLSFSLLMQYRQYTDGQDRQQLTKRLYFVYNIPGEKRLTRPPTDNEEQQQGEDDFQGIDPDLAKNKAIELSKQAAFKGFEAVVMVRFACSVYRD